MVCCNALSDYYFGHCSLPQLSIKNNVLEAVLLSSGTKQEEKERTLKGPPDRSSLTSSYFLPDDGSRTSFQNVFLINN